MKGWRPGMGPTWAVIHETSNGRVIVPCASEAAGRGAYARSRAAAGRFNYEHAIYLGGMLVAPDGDVLDRWGREFDPDGPPLFPRMTMLLHARVCARCGAQCPPGSVYAPATERCRTCTLATDPEPRPEPMQGRVVDTVPASTDDAERYRRRAARSIWG